MCSIPPIYFMDNLVLLGPIRLAPVFHFRFLKIIKEIMPKDVGTYLTEQQKKSSGDIATEWGQLEELYNKKYSFIFPHVQSR